MGVALIEQLGLGRVPRVVGTIITADYLRKWQAERPRLDCDLVELRVDGFPDFPGWLKIAQEIEASGIPTFATVRLAKEGGKWTDGDSGRWAILERAIETISGVDVELESELAERVCNYCRKLGKMSVVSHHDFERTPPLSHLESLIHRQQALGSVAKIAATGNSVEDVEHLRSLLHKKWDVPICIIGMGPLGRETRVKFPLEGSCFTYGYLDVPGAPGQYSATELRERLSGSAKD